jgi:hypothetical protein
MFKFDFQVLPDASKEEVEKVKELEKHTVGILRTVDIHPSTSFCGELCQEFGFMVLTLCFVLIVTVLCFSLLMVKLLHLHCVCVCVCVCVCLFV